MNQEIEDYSDEMKRETDDEMRNQMGKTTIAGFDLSNMGIVAQSAIMTIILSIFAAIGYFFYRELAVPKIDINEERKAKLRARKEKKQQ